MIPLHDIGIAFLDGSGKVLGSSGGAGNVEGARQEARIGLLHAYPNAVRAVIFAGRSYEEGEELAIVPRERQ